QQGKPIHARHVYVGQDHDQLRPDALRQHFQRRFAGMGEVQHIEALAHFVAEALAEQLGHVQLVVDDHDTDAHYAPLDQAACRRRGRRTVNSVNDPGALSASILPLCCWVTMSWLIDTPSPVPSPVGLVVKKGWNSRCRSCAGMPTPLSRMAISTASGRSRVLTFTVGRKASPSWRCRLST